MNKITSLEEYIKAVKKKIESWNLPETKTLAWFRGQSDAVWDIIPSILRDGDNSKERELIRDFKLQAKHYIDYKPSNDMEWLFIMQHYGMPTRLIDWSEGSLIALYFAVKNYKKKVDSCVWILDAWSLNRHSLNEYSVPTSEHNIIGDYLVSFANSTGGRTRAKKPLAIRPLRSTKRIIAQKGTFTIHGNECQSLDQFVCETNYEADDEEKVKLSKIIIQGDKKLTLLKELARSGITNSVVFPELEALSEEISFRYSMDNLGSNEGHSHSGF